EALASPDALAHVLGLDGDARGRAHVRHLRVGDPRRVDDRHLTGEATDRRHEAVLAVELEVDDIAGFRESEDLLELLDVHADIGALPRELLEDALLELEDEHGDVGRVDGLRFETVLRDGQLDLAHQRRDDLDDLTEVFHLDAKLEHPAPRRDTSVPSKKVAESDPPPKVVSPPVIPVPRDRARV